MPRSAALDSTVVGAGAVLLVAGFLPWWRAELLAGGVALTPLRGATAWDLSVAWWLPVLAGTVTGGLWLLSRLGHLRLGWLPAVTALVGGVGLALVVGRFVTLPGGGPSDFGWYAYSPLTEAGPPGIGGTPGIGLWLAGAALAAQAVAAGLSLRRRPAPPTP